MRHDVIVAYRALNSIDKERNLVSQPFFRNNEAVNKEKQKEKIAKFCGWKLKWQNKGGGDLFDEKPKGHCWEFWLHPDFSRYGEIVYPPDYLNDLNAVREVEKLLDDNQWREYEQVLEGMLWSYPMGVSRLLIHASAEDKCEAILRIIGEWEE